MSTHAEIMAVWDEETHPKGRRGILNLSADDLEDPEEVHCERIQRHSWEPVRDWEPARKRRASAAQKRRRYLMRKSATS